MGKIILDGTTGEQPPPEMAEEAKKAPPNIFQGATENQRGTENAKFPDWDILPPDQIINPRIRRS